MVAVPAAGAVVATRGDTFDMEVTFWSDTAKTQPYPVNGAQTVTSELRATTGSPVIATFEVTVVGTNLVRLGLSSAVTADLPVGGPPLAWDVQGVWAGTPPIVHTLVKGTLTVEGDITGSDTVVGMSVLRSTRRAG